MTSAQSRIVTAYGDVDGYFPHAITTVAELHSS
jgi:hypothetical protein